MVIEKHRTENTTQKSLDSDDKLSLQDKGSERFDTQSPTITAKAQIANVFFSTFMYLCDPTFCSFVVVVMNLAKYCKGRKSDVKANKCISEGKYLLYTMLRYIAKFVLEG